MQIVSNMPTGSTSSHHWDQLLPETETLEGPIMRLNALALSMLWEGREEQSHALMRWTLSTTLSKLRELASTPIQVNEGIPATSSPLDLSHILGQNGGSFSEQGQFLFYHNVFSIDADEEERSETESVASSSAPEEDPMTLTLIEDSFSHADREAGIWDLKSVYAAVLYNLAAVHHGTGIARGVLTDIGRAFQLYRRALAVIKSLDTTAAGTTCDLTHLKMALFSNLGHAADLLGDTATAGACCTGLTAALRLEQNKEDQNNHHDLSFFQRSLERASRLQGRFAPAA